DYYCCSYTTSNIFVF
nr:immunoglobulin light chain junction region [Macaca mulatta]